MIRILAEGGMVLMALVFHHGRHFGPIGAVRNVPLHIGHYTGQPRHLWNPQTGELAHFVVTRHGGLR